MPFETLELRHDGRRSWLTLSRPKALNALSGALLGDLDKALNEVEIRVAAGTYRGPGRFEGDFVRERLIDLSQVRFH